MRFLYHDVIVMLVVLFQKEQDDFHIRDAIAEDFKHTWITTNNIEY